MSERSCPHCGESWPKLSLHVCPEEPNSDNEALSALLFQAITQLDVPLGGINIATQIAAVVVRPLSRELMRRRGELEVALDG